MANLTITASSVIAGSDAQIGEGTAGGTITQGQPIYEDANDSNKLKAAVCTALASAVVKGIALTSASSGQPVKYIRSGNLTAGATLALGTIYVLSATSGAIAPSTDLASTNYVTTLGIATSTTILAVAPVSSGVQKP
jgi:hypothetical protein